MLKLTIIKAGLDYTLLEFLVRELPGDIYMLSPSKFENAFKDTVLTTGEKESRLLRIREYLYSKLRRKDQTDRLESSLVIDHGATPQLYNIECFRAISFVPIR